MPIIKTTAIKDAIAHTTDREIEFIDKLGCYTGQFRAADLLKNYIAACDKRTDWDEMNGRAIKQAAIDRFNSIEKRAA